MTEPVDKDRTGASGSFQERSLATSLDSLSLVAGSEAPHSISAYFKAFRNWTCFVILTTFPPCRVEGLSDPGLQAMFVEPSTGWVRPPAGMNLSPISGHIPTI